MADELQLVDSPEAIRLNVERFNDGAPRHSHRAAMHLRQATIRQTASRPSSLSPANLS